MAKPYYALETFYSPGIANMADGRRFAIAGSTWIEIGPEVTSSMLTAAWTPVKRTPVNLGTVEDKVFEVVSKRSGEKYEVKSSYGKWSCTCPGFEYRKKCKHIEEIKNRKK